MSPSASRSWKHFSSMCSSCVDTSALERSFCLKVDALELEACEEEEECEASRCRVGTL